MQIEIKGEIGGLVKDVAPVRQDSPEMIERREIKRRIDAGLVVVTPAAGTIRKLLNEWIAETFPDANLYLQAYPSSDGRGYEWHWYVENEKQAMAIKLYWG